MRTAPNKTEFKTISKRARQLLNREEGYDVEFKESISGLNSEDLVAFANSEAGGSILIGVAEKKGKGGRQESVVKGCSIGDRAKQSILSRAESCVPRIELEVFSENTGKLPFFRIEIPSGKDKPYGALGGTYKIRGDGRNKALLPSILLAMFVDIEAGRFVERFQQATQLLEQNIQALEWRLKSELQDLDYGVNELTAKTVGTLQEIIDTARVASDSSEDGRAFSEEAVDAVSGVSSQIDTVDDHLSFIDTRLRAVMAHFDIEDPYLASARIQAKAFVQSMLSIYKKEGKRLTKKAMMEMLKEGSPAITDEQAESWCDEARKEFRIKYKGS